MTIDELIKAAEADDWNVAEIGNEIQFSRGVWCIDYDRWAGTFRRYMRFAVQGEGGPDAVIEAMSRCKEGRPE